MTFLGKRIKKLERQSESYACIEDFLAVHEAEKRGVSCEKEWERIKATKWWSEFSGLLESARKN